MMYYLKHPQHGTKIATLEAEKDADVAAGWREYTPNAEKVSALETPAEYVNSMEVKRPARAARSKV